MSNEEKLFFEWCNKLVLEGYLRDFEYNSLSCNFSLSDTVRMPVPGYSKTKKGFKAITKDKNILRKCSYTCDFLLKGLNHKIARFCNFVPFIDDYYIETKGSKLFNFHTSDVSLHAKRTWLYQSQGIYVNVCKMPSFFKKTFFPLCDLTLKINGGVRKPYMKYSNFSDFEASLR